jgi:hypothetical protein
MTPKEKTKLMKLDYLTLCDYATVSKENKLSVIGIFDQLLVDKIPVNHPSMYIVGILSGEIDSNYSVVVEIKDPSGKQLFVSSSLENTFGTNGRSNLLISLNSFPIPTSGRYSITVETKGLVLGETNFDVYRAKREQSVGKPSKSRN